MLHFYLVHIKPIIYAVLVFFTIISFSLRTKYISLHTVRLSWALRSNLVLQILQIFVKVYLQIFYIVGYYYKCNPSTKFWGFYMLYNYCLLHLILQSATLESSYLLLLLFDHLIIWNFPIYNSYGLNCIPLRFTY